MGARINLHPVLQQEVNHALSATATQSAEWLEASHIEWMQKLEPAAHMYPSDLEKFQENETFAQAFSVAVGCPDETSVPLYAIPAKKDTK